MAPELAPRLASSRRFSAPRRVAFVLGDTIGHVMLPVAIAEAYRRAVPGTEVLFLAARESARVDFVRRHGYTITLVPGLPLMRVGLADKVSALVVALASVMRLRGILRAHDSQLVIGSGGCVSGPALVAARTLGLRAAIVEPNAVPGLANRLLRRVAQRAYCTFATAAAVFPSASRVLTGTPIREGIARMPAPKRGSLSRDRAFRVLVASGSRGEAFLAAHMPPLLALLRQQGLRFDVVHQAGSVDVQAVEDAYRAAGVSAQVVPFIGEMWETYAWADLAITRAGASTLAELALAGLPALVVPLADAAGDHQADNARSYAETGAARWVAETQWEEREVATTLADLLLRFGVWERMAESAFRQAVPDAAAAIVRDCEALIDAPC